MFHVVNSVMEVIDIYQNTAEEANTKIIFLNNLKDYFIYNDEKRF